MGTQTGDVSWKQRYDSYIPKLDDSIRSLMKEVSAKDQQDVMQVTVLSNKKLIELACQGRSKSWSRHHYWTDYLR